MRAGYDQDCWLAGAAKCVNRRLLLEGPYRRWEAALGRSNAEV